MSGPGINHAIPSLVVIAIGVVVALVLGGLEWRRALPWRAARTIVQVVMIAELTTLVVQPQFTHDREVRPVLALTSNYDARVADSLQQAHPELEVYRGLLDGDQLPSQPLAAVLGDGLTAATLDEHPQLAYYYHTGVRPAGIIDLQCEPAYVGRTSKVHGTLSGSAGSKVLITGPAGAEDSALIKSPGLTNFALRYRPRTTGIPGYQLIVRDSTGRISTAALPIEVAAPRSLQLLMLLDHPTAEVRFLKTWLDSRGHQLHVRTRVSKSTYREEHLHTAPVPLTLQSTLLDQTDLVIVDAATWNNLSTVDRNRLKQSVTRGLGVLALVTGDALTRYPGVGKVGAADTVTVHAPDTTMTLPSRAVESTAQEAIWKDKRMLAGYQYEGLGRWAFQSLHETYRLAAAGAEDGYAALWLPVLESTARRTPQSTLDIQPTFPLTEDEPLHVNVIAEAAPTLLADGLRVTLQEDVVLDGWWHGRTWAGKPGWHTLGWDGVQRNYLVSAADEWKAMKIMQQQQLNQQRHRAAISTTPVHVTVTEPLPAWITLMVVLLSALVLWLAPKF